MGNRYEGVIIPKWGGVAIQAAKNNTSKGFNCSAKSQ
jgi:hypothetical protein